MVCFADIPFACLCYFYYYIFSVAIFLHRFIFLIREVQSNSIWSNNILSSPICHTCYTVTFNPKTYTHIRPCYTIVHIRMSVYISCNALEKKKKHIQLLREYGKSFGEQFSQCHFSVWSNKFICVKGVLPNNIGLSYHHFLKKKAAQVETEILYAAVSKYTFVHTYEHTNPEICT